MFSHFQQLEVLYLVAKMPKAYIRARLPVLINNYQHGMDGVYLEVLQLLLGTIDPNTASDAANSFHDSLKERVLNEQLERRKRFS